MRRIRGTRFLLALLLAIPVGIFVVFFGAPLVASFVFGPPATLLVQPGFCESADKNIIFEGKGVGGSDLYKWDAQTKRIFRIVQTPYAESAPDLSPNGRWLVCEYFDFHFPGSSGLILIDLQNKSYQKLAANDAKMPVFSPDGKRVAFIRFGMSALSNQIDGDVFETDLATRREKQLTHNKYHHLRSVNYSSNNEICFTGTEYNTSTKSDDAFMARLTIGQPPHETPLPNDNTLHISGFSRTENCVYASSSRQANSTVLLSAQKWRFTPVVAGTEKLAERRREILFSSVDWHKNKVAICGYSLVDGKTRTYFGVDL